MSPFLQLKIWNRRRLSAHRVSAHPKSKCACAQVLDQKDGLLLLSYRRKWTIDMDLNIMLCKQSLFFMGYSKADISGQKPYMNRVTKVVILCIFVNLMVRKQYQKCDLLIKFPSFLSLPSFLRQSHYIVLAHLTHYVDWDGLKLRDIHSSLSSKNFVMCVKPCSCY